MFDVELSNLTAFIKADDNARIKGSSDDQAFGNNGNPSTIGNTNDRKNGFVDPLEPWRIRTTDDGRVFVSSYSKSSATAVWELTSNAPYYRNWNAVLNKSDIGNRRVIGMDVKGSGSQLTLLVLCQGNGKELKCYEINLGTSTQYNSSTHTLTEKKVPSNINFYEDGINGHAQVAYGNGGAIWYSFGIEAAASKLYRVKADGTTTSYSYGSNYGGEGFIIKNNLLIKGFRTTSSNSGIYIYGISNDNLDATASYIVPEANTIGTGSWITDFALDYANNLYAASSYYGRVMPISLPYSGTRTTRAQTKFNFRLNPVPNILATDLRFAPDGNSDRYVFSFNVNTTPEVAQIRFYKSYGDNGENDMKKNLAKINADNYQGGNAITPSFVYEIPAGQLKQGKISVSLGMCGGIIEGGKITNNKLPRGEWYWSVYVEAPRKSSVFAPIYEQSTTGIEEHYRLHAAVNNYPETDGFGHIYAVNYHNEFDSRNGLMEYGFNPSGESDDNQNTIKNAYRYILVKNYKNPTGEKPKFTNQRRLVVAPDGKVYIADCGHSTFDANAERPMCFTGGGVFVWNPNTQKGDELQIAMFSTNDLYNTATGVDIYNHNGQLKLYATNTYGEFENHSLYSKIWKTHEYTEANQADVNIYGWNGFKEYNLGTPENILQQETSGTILRSLGMGDGNGHISLVAMDKGVWLAQNRLNDVQYSLDIKTALPDNTENYILSFVPYESSTRTWKSCTNIGVTYGDGSGTPNQDGASELTQLTSSPLQSCPGAGLAYRKFDNKEFLYIVNHQGNIVELQITGWSDNTPSIKYIKTYPGSGPKGTNDGGRIQGAINSMCFDYAGNLVTTSGVRYIGTSQNIIVYTMPYDRVNAREIQAPNSCRYIPERVSHLNMGDGELNNIISENQGNTCHVDIYRPMFNTAFSTICLPFDVNLSEASANEYKDAKLMRFAEAVITDINKEKMLELRFTEITNGQLEAGIPYLIQPQEPITQIVHLAQEVSFKLLTPEDLELEVNFTDGDQNNSITFKGIIPYQQIEVDPNKPWPLIVVDNNRLAEVSSTGYINGFRAYFQLEKELEPGTKVGISARKPTPTNVITIDGKRVNVEKFLREGRVYIRVGDTLYTINGEKL